MPLSHVSLLTFHMCMLHAEFADIDLTNPQDGQVLMRSRVFWRVYICWGVYRCSFGDATGGKTNHGL